MIVLTETTDKLQIVLGAVKTTNDFECVASWRDITTTTYTPGRTVVESNGTNDVDIVGSPGASTQRVIDFVSLYNADTILHTVTVKFDANGTEYILWKGDIPSLGKLEYNDNLGWVATPLAAYGYCIHVTCTDYSPGDSVNNFFGMNLKDPVSTADVNKVHIRKAGTIKIANIYCYSNNAGQYGTAENWSCYIRLNNTTDYLVATVGTSAQERVFSNSALDIPVVAGDYFEMKMVNPGWATNPLVVTYAGYVYIE